MAANITNKKYEVLEHPAELRLRIYGKTIEELFINAAFALANSQNKNITLHRRSSIKCYREEIKIESIDLNSLLVDFLSEILARSQINKCIYQVSKLQIQNSKLIATLTGYPVDRFDEDIKAITYQDVDIRQGSNRTAKQLLFWQTDLVFDI